MGRRKKEKLPEEKTLFSMPRSLKMLKCKITGTVDLDGCYTCFKKEQHKNFSSRVQCKSKNITEEISVPVT